MVYKYIIAVSGKRILPADEPNRIYADLVTQFGEIRKIESGSWNLTNGSDEVKYAKSVSHPIPQKRIDDIRRYFEAKYRNIEFYLLQKVE